MTVIAHERNARDHPVPTAVVVLVAVVAVIVGVVIGVVGARHDSVITPVVHVGGGQVGLEQASLHDGDGPWVAVEPGVLWYDADGTEHDGPSMPSCLQHIGPVQGIRWADVTTRTPSGGSLQVVTYVDCSRTR